VKRLIWVGDNGREQFIVVGRYELISEALDALEKKLPDSPWHEGTTFMLCHVVDEYVVKLRIEKA